MCTSLNIGKVGNLKGYLFWPPFLKVFCQKWKFGTAKEMSASAGIWTRVPRSKGSYAIQWATPLLIENQQKLASYNNFCFGPFLTKNFQKGNGQNRYIFELLTLAVWISRQFDQNKVDTAISRRLAQSLPKAGNSNFTKMYEPRPIHKKSRKKRTLVHGRKCL